MKGVVWAEQLAQAAAGLVGLGPAILRELNAVIGDCLVYLAVLWTEGGQLWLGQGHREDWRLGRKALLLPSDWAWRMRIISRGFAMVAMRTCGYQVRC